MPTIDELKAQLSPETRETVDVLQGAERTLKARLSEEIWALVECVRMHPEITGPARNTVSSDADLTAAVVFSHFVDHAKRIVRLAGSAERATDLMTKAIANELGRDLEPATVTYKVEVHHA